MKQKLRILLLFMIFAISLSACEKSQSGEIDENGMFLEVTGNYLVQNVMIQGMPLELDKTYLLACHDYFIKEGGGGINMFQDDTLLQDSVMLDNQLLIQYITNYLGGLIGSDYANPYGQGRINIK